MRRALVLAVFLFACKREETKVCPDPVSSAKPAAAPMRTIDVPFPKATASDEVLSFLRVEIDAGGKTFVNGVAVADDKAITEAAAKAMKADPKVKAVIMADRATPHGRVIVILDHLRMGGISSIAFAVSASGPEH